MERVIADLGIPPEFDLNSLGNLLPAHRYCNQRKSDQIFHPARARYFLEIAASKEVAVRRCIDKAELQYRKEHLLSGLRASLDSGIVTIRDLSDMIHDCGSFPVAAEVAFVDGSIRQRIHQDEIDQLLDKQILFGKTSHIDGVEFINGSGQTMTIRTCRDYRAAKVAGYYAPTSFAMKMEGYVSALDAILWAVASTKLASVSYINSPFVGVADLHLMRRDMLPRIGPDDDAGVATITEPSLRELLRSRKISVIDVSSVRLQFEWGATGVVLAELLRGDVDGDGAEEILLQHYTYAVGGTFGCSSVGLLRRSEPDGMFDYVANWRQDSSKDV